MKYKLNPDFSFCGWDGLPYALRDRKSKKVSFLSREQFMLLWSCDGYSETDEEKLTEDEKKFLKRLVGTNVISGVDGNGHLQLHDYTEYPCRYRSDVQLSITGRCNYRCKHCFQSAPHGVFGQPATEEIFNELDQLAECGVYRVSITGGEPLIHPGFWDIVDYIVKKDMVLTTVYSNGALINNELLDGFDARGIKPSWSVSFDGLGCHDEMRGVPGAEQKAIDAIKLLVSRGFRVGCGYTLTKKSMAVFRKTVNFLASIGVHSIKSGCTMMQGEWLNNPEAWLSDEDYLKFYCEYIPQYIADGKPLNLQFEGLFYGEKGPDGKYSFLTERNIPEERFPKVLSCQTLKGVFYIGPTGNVLPCMGLDGTPAVSDFDSLRTKPLREILSKGSRFIEATGATIGDVFTHNSAECANCGERAHCGSGCRSSAIGANGNDYLALDKRTCMLCKEDWAGKIKEAILKSENNG